MHQKDSTDKRYTDLFHRATVYSNGKSLIVGIQPVPAYYTFAKYPSCLSGPRHSYFSKANDESEHVLHRLHYTRVQPLDPPAPAQQWAHTTNLRRSRKAPVGASVSRNSKRTQSQQQESGNVYRMHVEKGQQVEEIKEGRSCYSRVCWRGTGKDERCGDQRGWSGSETKGPVTGARMERKGWTEGTHTHAGD
jgi:hypothetical protein